MPGEVSRNHPMSDLDDWERGFWREYRQSNTACCPRETIPDSCSCPDGCSCWCLDCICGEEECEPAAFDNSWSDDPPIVLRFQPHRRADGSRDDG